MSALTRAMSENDLLSAIIEAAQLYGWRVHHDRRSDKAITQGNVGFPDLVLARRQRVLFIETKSEQGRLTEAQRQWCSALPDYWLVRPADLDTVIRALQ